MDLSAKNLTSIGQLQCWAWQQELHLHLMECSSCNQKEMITFQTTILYQVKIIMMVNIDKFIHLTFTQTIYQIDHETLQSKSNEWSTESSLAVQIWMLSQKYEAKQERFQSKLISLYIGATNICSLGLYLLFLALYGADRVTRQGAWMHNEYGFTFAVQNVHSP